MESPESKMGRFADKVSEEKLSLFTELLRKNLIEAGVNPDLFDNAAQATTLELHVQEAQSSLVDQALRTFENRGMDTVGRIVVEYCFIRSTSGKMLWPEYSDEDSMARWQFKELVLPRPLMRYFLVSVRGTIDEIDGFTSDSYLYDGCPERIETVRNSISEYIEDFKGPFGSGESSVDWQAVYEDQRFRQIALGIIADMRAKFDEHGLEGYLNYLQEYRRNDPKGTETNLMQRSIGIEDATQISMALAEAESRLRDSVV